MGENQKVEMDLFARMPAASKEAFRPLIAVAAETNEWAESAHTVAA